MTKEVHYVTLRGVILVALRPGGRAETPAADQHSDLDEVGTGKFIYVIITNNEFQCRVSRGVGEETSFNVH